MIGLIFCTIFGNFGFVIFQILKHISGIRSVAVTTERESVDRRVVTARDIFTFLARPKKSASSVRMKFKKRDKRRVSVTPVESLQTQESLDSQSSHPQTERRGAVKDISHSPSLHNMALGGLRTIQEERPISRRIAARRHRFHQQPTNDISKR
mmetsp:Transcript_65575/g.75436  ORF Transcript_65575/g.75436 Transcript_65575/m.75436 type:complete len:153 (-) Transcript_65575:149-607(-)